MKNIFLLSVAICSSQFVMAGKDIDVQNYYVTSDVFAIDVPKGKCLVVGNVIKYDDYIQSGMTYIQGAEISTLDRKKSSLTDASGNYSLLLDETDTSIFCFKKGMDEIVVWNYHFQSQHRVQIIFVIGEEPMMQTVDKPVIYLYSDSEINAEIQFSCKGDLTFTYPAYNEKWEVTVNQNKITENKSGKSYPYLFWEAETNELNFQYDMLASTDLSMDGFIISTDTVVSFLENSLTALGLNSTEQADFITYWAPKMILKPYALVQFFVDDLYERKISEMKIVPTPDAIRRVFMLYHPLETNNVIIPVFPQKLNSFVRSGFTVVEWGGSESQNPILKP